ncbi:hypothetical protein [Streptomyces stelliscabiei]|uniref:hypothetical protein n=1 Tax=Streptomyces stelliscabiei TaxID=146820 RepID=UPI0029BA6E93|nr:hypothetical protein [Streptomyces stelliscabiei]MDX2639926.1 hypothetical protein [Streptomyces stelliscabiei]MDX2662840.1 hypothetical protein [Streptomyces stelliscabiei]MDX2714506.1 hypothetical protein [Streptomyces stelliscabiei]MDX2792243.1 hypothetical protein [Streptomyces stelliscabiei]
MAASQDADTGTSFAWCSWHENFDRTARLVRVPDDQGSGHGAGGLFACFSCRQAYGLSPVADQP